MDPIDDLASRRPTREDKQGLFDIEPDWREHWWGMPDYTMNDAQPAQRITMNFMTYEDVLEFAEKIGARVTNRTNSLFYPQQEQLKGEFEYNGKKTDSRYPICIPSKGRYDVQTTGKVLDSLGVSYKFFVEETEEDLYKEHVGEDKVVSMPFNNLGQGSIPARNFIWEWAKEREYARHWVVDDNITDFSRTHMNRRLIVRGGGFFNAMEDFADRYENIALAGPHSRGFVADRDPRKAAFIFNSRVYSCILIDTNLDYRWRGRYNEDTDLSLRMLKDGLCTVLFAAFTMQKFTTHKGTGKDNGGMKGGNTDNVYNDEDYRLSFAKSLQEQHPDVVDIIWRWGRWHHHVDYTPFKKNKPVLRAGVTKTKEMNNYGMELVRKNG